MNDQPEKVAAILAIGVLAKYRRSSWGGLFLDLIRGRDHFDEVAAAALEPENLPLEPFMRHVVGVIVRHFTELPAESPLPTEQELTDWIVARGGISALLLERMAHPMRPVP